MMEHGMFRVLLKRCLSPEYSIGRLMERRAPRLWAYLNKRLPANSLRRSMATGAFWSVLGAVASRGFMLVTEVLIARLLGKAGYGEWGTVRITVVTFGLLGSFGVGLTATKHVAELRKTDPERAGRVLSLALLVGLAMVAGVSLVAVATAPLMAHTLYKAPQLQTALMLSAAMLFCLTMTGGLQAAMAGFEDFRGIARNNLWQGVAMLLLAAPMTWRWGLTGAVAGASMAQAVGMFLALIEVFRLCRQNGMSLSIRGTGRERRVLLTFAVPSLVADGVGGVAQMLSQAMVARLPGGMAALGGFRASVTWRDVLLFLPESLRRVVLPILSRLKGQRDEKRYVKALLANIALNTVLALLGAIPLMLLSRWILGLYGESFRGDWDMMVVLLGGGVLQAARDVVMQTTTSLGRVWWNTLTAIAWGAVTLGGTALLLPGHGVRGYVYASVAAMAVSLTMYAAATRWLVRKRTGFLIE